MGGWASIKTMDEKVKEFELFDRCKFGADSDRGDGVGADTRAVDAKVIYKAAAPATVSGGGSSPTTAPRRRSRQTPGPAPPRRAL